MTRSGSLFAAGALLLAACASEPRIVHDVEVVEIPVIKYVLPEKIPTCGFGLPDYGITWAELPKTIVGLREDGEACNEKIAISNQWIDDHSPTSESTPAMNPHE